jgi:hypothetical protein
LQRAVLTMFTALNPDPYSSLNQFPHLPPPSKPAIKKTIWMKSNEMWMIGKTTNAKVAPIGSAATVCGEVKTAKKYLETECCK